MYLKRKDMTLKNSYSSLFKVTWLLQAIQGYLAMILCSRALWACEPSSQKSPMQGQCYLWLLQADDGT